MASELKPCPFCGCNAIVEGYSNWWVRCECCLVETRTFKTEAEAIEAWNRRAEDGK